MTIIKVIKGTQPFKDGLQITEVTTQSDLPEGDPPSTAKSRLEGFEEYCRREITSNVEDLKKHRTKSWTRKVPWLILLLAACVGAFALEFDWLGLICIFAGWATILNAQDDLGKISGNRSIFDANRVCAFLGLTYSYDDGPNVVPWFHKLGLLPGYDRSKLEDFITGEIDGVDLLLCEATLESQCGEENSGGSVVAVYENVFRGLLIVVSFPKQFDGTTVIHSEALFNFLEYVHMPGERVKLEDPRFEKRFQVFTTDQIEARYLLTPIFMERLSAIDKYFNGNLEAAFDHNCFLLAIKTSHNWFNPDGGVVVEFPDSDHVGRLVQEFNMIFDVVDILNLNTKTKI